MQLLQKSKHAEDDSQLYMHRLDILHQIQNPKPKTIIPKPKTQNLKPKTLNLQPKVYYHVLNLKTLNPNVEHLVAHCQ